MSAKMGVLHDYDLMANAEPSAQGQVCVVCGDNPVSYQWSDYSGQAMCRSCGTPYQLKWGSDEQVAEGAYPYLSLKPEWVPVVREYFRETGRFTCFGMMMGPRPGLREFNEWADARYPDGPPASEPKP